jgi:hypothetical protein
LRVAADVRIIAAGVLLVLAFSCASGAGAAAPVRVSVSGELTVPVSGTAWTLKLAVRPASYEGAVAVTAAGPRRLTARATGGHGSYRARFVFPSAGRWTLTARAGASTSRLGSVQVRPAPPQPLEFTEPTSIEVEPSGTLLLVENNPGRLLRLDPATGRVTVVVASSLRPYSVVHAPSGVIFFSGDGQLHRIDASGAVATVASAGTDIGPIAVAPNGDVYYATATQASVSPAARGRRFSSPAPASRGEAATAARR